MWIRLVPFLFLGSLFAQTAPPEKGALEGQIVDAITGAPVKKAQITLRRIESRNASGSGTSTDAAGHFAMQNIEPGRYRLWAERNGFVRQEYGARGAGRQGTVLTLDPGKHITDIALRLTPHSTVTGTIVDEDAEPIAGVSVQMLKHSYRNGRKQLTPAGFAQTNDLGEYRVFGVPPGRYYVAAIYRQPFGIVDRTAKPSPTPTEEQVYAPTYYPGATDVSSAAPVELKAGNQLSGVNLTLRKMHAVRIRGSIGAAGSVSLRPRDSGGADFNRNVTRVRDSSGAFELRGVLPGAYILSAQTGDRDHSNTARLPLNVGANDIEGIRITPAPAGNITGQVRSEGDVPANLAALHVYLNAQDAGSNSGAADSAVKPNGAFLLEEVGPGDYVPSVVGVPDGFYLKSMRFGDREVLDTGLDLSNGGAGALEVVLGAGGGSIEGVVSGPKPAAAAGATVVLIPEPSRREQRYRYKTATADQAGKFKLAGIAPGDYKVFAWEDIESGAYLDSEFIKAVEERGQAFSIKENAHESAQLKLITAEDNGPNSSQAQP
ncbi:MAG: carboxypeptidase regulatory-like domain-containing protein [Acidobacteriota bacterium]|nr:carboxypeptidase regulatory-like domain-containing protein [Acidobacteriota bacterium]